MPSRPTDASPPERACSTPRPGAPRTAVLLGLDGVVHVSDLPVQSFARHATEQLPPADEVTRSLIGGMRGFLEGRPDLLPTDPAVKRALEGAEVGDQAVEILCRAAGLSPRQVVEAHRAARVDLANSAWAIDPAPGLAELIAGLPPHCYVAVVAPDLTGLAEVVDAVGITARIDEFLVDPGGTEGRAQVVERALAVVDATTAPDHLLVVGARWDPDLAVPHAAGCSTALVDRFGHGHGTPNCRAAGLAGMVPAILDWATRAGRTGS